MKTTSHDSGWTRPKGKIQTFQDLGYAPGCKPNFKKEKEEYEKIIDNLKEINMPVFSAKDIAELFGFKINKGHWLIHKWMNKEMVERVREPSHKEPALYRVSHRDWRVCE